jgi:DNA-binding NarL/FixJ family response regulator
MTRAWHAYPIGLSAITPRQRAIVDLRCRRGLSNGEAAYALHIRESTVKNHITTVRARMGMRTMNEICFEYGRAHQVTGQRADDI